MQTLAGRQKQLSADVAEYQRRWEQMKKTEQAKHGVAFRGTWHFRSNWAKCPVHFEVRATFKVGARPGAKFPDEDFLEF